MKNTDTSMVLLYCISQSTVRRISTERRTRADNYFTRYWKPLDAIKNGALFTWKLFGLSNALTSHMLNTILINLLVNHAIQLAFQ